MLIKKYLTALAFSISLFTSAALAHDKIMDASAVVDEVFGKYQAAMAICDVATMRALTHPKAGGFEGAKLIFESSSAEQLAEQDKKTKQWCAKGGKTAFSYDIINAEFIVDGIVMTTFKMQFATTDPGQETKYRNAYGTDLLINENGHWLLRYGHSTEIK